MPRKNRLCGRVKRRRPIFPWGYPHSIVRAEELNFRVRDGDGCTLFAIVTGSPAHTGGSLDRVHITTSVHCCQEVFRQIFAPGKNLSQVLYFLLPLAAASRKKRTLETPQTPAEGFAPCTPLRWCE